MHPLIFVLYDGIENSVFPGQVLAPLLEHKKEHPEIPVHIISFERNSPALEKLKNNEVHFHIFRRLPFLGIFSMWHSIYYLKKILNQFPSYKLIARGPLAGYVCLQAATAQRCSSLTLQARGLLAEEYSYTHTNYRSFVHKLWHTWRARSLRKIERYVYQKKSYSLPTTIEAVSPALKEHLAATYNTPWTCITIAHHDIPQPVPPEKKAQWRQEVRQEMAIPDNVHVYCYNGSVKAWQCPEMAVDFFKTELEKNPRSFLLILTQDQQPFLKLLHAAEIDPRSYHVTTVAHHEIYRHLAACDIGILFRKPSIVNWISRPTKALEYRALGLNIVHNNTVAYLENNF